MPEWLIERGIGEDRAVLFDRGEPLAARCRWPGEANAGEIVEAKLVSKAAGSSRGTAIGENGREILVDRIPSSATEGSTLTLQIKRGAIFERGRFKRAQATIALRGDEDCEKDVWASGKQVRAFPSGVWENIWLAASSGEIAFSGGSLIFSVTPAMTLIDIDGDLPPRELALAAVPQIARSLRLFDLGGSIGIDFPTLTTKSDRKAVDTSLEQALCDWLHERTAMNGFGFVQLVARLDGPSLLHRFATSRVGASARMAMRTAELVEGPGTTLLTVHPALRAKLKPEWIAELEHRTGRPVRIESDPGLALEAPSAQIVAA